MNCTDSSILVYLAVFRRILTLIQIIAPILGIISLAYIFIKMMMNPEDKKLPKQLKNSLIALVLLFFIPLLVRVTINLVSSNSSYSDCLEEEEQSSINTSAFKEAEYIEIDSSKKKNSILTDPDDYEKGEKNNSDSAVSPANDQFTISNSNAVYFLNTGASSDAFIIQDNGKFALIDTSLESQGDFIVSQLKKLGATELEFILITHSHVDHVGGYSKIMNNFPVKALFIKKDGTIYPAHEGTYKRLITTAESHNTFVCDVKLPSCQTFSLGNINFQLYNTEFLSAAGMSSKNRGRFDNANSIAAVANINGRRVYFSGDIGNYFGYNQESITASQIGDIDVYKVAHHGYVSFNNNQDALNYLKAEYAVVTNGSSTAAEAIRRVKKANSNFIKEYYTTNGTVSMTIDTSGNIQFYQ